MKRFHLPPMHRFLPQLDAVPYLYVVWRWLWLVVLCAVLGGAAAFLVSLNTAPIYEATSKLLINQARTPTDVQYNDILASERTARTYAELMARDSTLAEAFRQLGIDPTSIEIQVTDLRVTPVRDTQLVELTVEGPSPDLITAVANTLPQVFVTELRTVQTARYAESKASLSEQMDTLRRQIEETQLALRGLEDARTAQEELEVARLTNLLTQYQVSYSDILQNYETLRLAEAQSVDNIVVMEQAQPPTDPIRPRTLVNTLLAAIVGGMLALGAIFLIEFLDDRVRSPDDLGRITDLPVLGAIAHTPYNNPDDYGPDKLISLQQPRHPTVEAYRRLRTNLQYANVDTPLRSLMVTSSGVNEGKTLTAANLAIVLAQSGRSVILVDADLRRPRQHSLFGVNKQPGIAEAILAEDATPYLLKPGVEIPNLQLLTAGDSVPFPAEVLGSQKMKSLLIQLGELADFVVVDTPPVLAVTDAQVVGRLADGALLVIDAQTTTGLAVRRALESMLQVQVPMLGAVLNRMDGSARGYYHMYGYYHYRAEREDSAQPAVQRNGHEPTRRMPVPK